MTHSLSNPYELTINGRTCKTSPYGNGFVIDGGDLEKMGKEKDAFKNDLFRLYHCQPNVNARSNVLESIIVFRKKSTGINE